MRLIYIERSLITLPIIVLIFPLVCLAGEPRSLTRLIDPIEVPGLEVRAISGLEISNLRAIALRDGKLRPIPFQIDQKSANNDWIWNVIYPPDNVNDWSNDEASELSDSQEYITHDDQDPSGKNIFDDNDIVVFLAKDAGDKDRKSVMRLGTEKLVELEIIDPVDQGKGWVYLAYFKKDAPALSDGHYVRYEPEKHLVSGPEQEFLYSPSYPMVLDDFRLDGVSVLVSNRIRGKVKVGIGPVSLDFEFNENSIQGYNAGYINGPVRVIKRSVEYVQLGPGITSPLVNCDHFHYPWHAEIPILISKQFPVQQVSILATSIFSESQFVRAEADGFEKPFFLGTESTDYNLLMDNTDAEWIELAGEGISVIHSVKIPAEHKGHLDVYPYLAINRGVSDTYDANKLVFGVEMGFTIRTTDKTPNGDHVVHSVFLSSVNFNKDKNKAVAIRMLQDQLIINAVTLRQK